MPPRRLRKQHLKAVERRKRLELDQPRLEALRRPDQPEVHLHERRPVLALRGAERLGDDGICRAPVLGVPEELRHDRLRLGDEPVHQFPGEKTWRLGEMELDVPAALPLELGDERLVTGRRERFVELGAQMRNQIRNRPFSMIFSSSTQMSKLVPTTSMWVDDHQVAPVWLP